MILKGTSNEGFVVVMMAIQGHIIYGLDGMGKTFSSCFNKMQ